MSSIISSAKAQTLIEELESFTLFPKLPLELRRMCWKYALPGPKVITITRCISHLVKNDWVNQDHGYHRVAKSNAISPVMLFVSSESREVALAFYKLSFSALLLRPVYLNFNLDSLFFPSSISDLGSFLVNGDDDKPSGEIAKVQHVMVGIERMGLHIYSVRYLKRFTSLVSLVLTHDTAVSLETRVDEGYKSRQRLSTFMSAWGGLGEANDEKLKITSLELGKVHVIAARGVHGL